MTLPVWANSSLYRKVNGELLVDDSIQVHGRDFPPFLLGDSAYPLLPWLVKPFSLSSSLTSQQKLCNYRLSRARVVVEVAFGRLKGRWRRLSKQIDLHIDNVPRVIAACCVLHNLFEIHQDTFDSDWLQDLDQPDSVPQGATQTSSGCTQGEEVREILMEYFRP